MPSRFEEQSDAVLAVLLDYGYNKGILDNLFDFLRNEGYTGSLEDMAYEAGVTDVLDFFVAFNYEAMYDSGDNIILTSNDEFLYVEK